jgi:hypothetical protein
MVSIRNLPPLDVTAELKAAAEKANVVLLPGTGDRLAAASVRKALADAIEEGTSGAGMEALVIELAASSGLHPMEVRRLAVALQRDTSSTFDTTAGIAAEAARLQARAAHRRAASALTLPYLLPAPIAEALELRTRYLPADAPAVVCLFLSSVASLQKIGSRITGNPASGFTVPLNLWAAIVASSGQKKSPLLRRVILEPTDTIAKSLADENRRELQEWEEAIKTAKKGQKPAPPQPLRLNVGDVTGEALAAQLVTLAERGRGLLVLRDELAALFTGLNQYKGGSGNDGQFLLELFDGGGHTSLRISGTREFRDSLVSIAGCIQPTVLGQLVNASTGDADGRYARFVFAPLTQEPKRLPCATPVEQAAIDRAGTYLQKIAAVIHREPPRHLHLAPDAMELFADYEHRQALNAAAATIPAQGAVLGKSAGKVLRVAGLLHRLDMAAGIAEDLMVGPHPLMRAIDLIEHLNGWVLGLHADLVDDGGPTSLMRSVHRIAREADEAVRTRDVLMKLSKAQRKEVNTEAVALAMRALAENGYGEVEVSPKGVTKYRAVEALP